MTLSIIPETDAGTSRVTLSVSNSTIGSSTSTKSPCFFIHLETVASTTDSPKTGTRISIPLSFRLFFVFSLLEFCITEFLLILDFVKCKSTSPFVTRPSTPVPSISEIFKFFSSIIFAAEGIAIFLLLLSTILRSIQLPLFLFFLILFQELGLLNLIVLLYA